MEQRVERTVLIPAGLDRVWEALTRREMLRDWFGAEVLELEVRRGGRLTVRTGDGGLRRGVIDAVEAPVRLAFRWLPIEELPGGIVAAIDHTTVEFRLDQTSEGTELTVVETALSGLAEDAAGSRGARALERT